MSKESLEFITTRWEEARNYYKDNKERVIFNIGDPQKPEHTFYKIDDKLYHANSEALKNISYGKKGEVAVIKAVDEENKIFAIKTVNTDKENVEQGELTALKHIGESHGDCTDGNIFYLVMDYKPGQELYKVYNQDNLDENGKRIFNKDGSYTPTEINVPLEVSLILAIKCAEAVAKLHERRLIHNDIKPQNFMADFGGKDITKSEDIKFIIENPNTVTVNTIDYEFSVPLMKGQTSVMSPIRRTHPLDDEGKPIESTDEDGNKILEKDWYIAPEIDPDNKSNITNGKVKYSKQSDIFALMNMLYYDLKLNYEDLDPFFNKTLALDGSPETKNIHDRPSAQEVAHYFKRVLEQYKLDRTLKTELVEAKSVGTPTIPRLNLNSIAPYTEVIVTPRPVKTQRSKTVSQENNTSRRTITPFAMLIAEEEKTKNPPRRNTLPTDATTSNPKNKN